MKKTLSVIIFVCIIIISLALLVCAQGITLSVGNIQASSGESVTVPVSISGNTGIAGAVLSVTYDSSLTLTNVTSGEAFSSLTFTKPGNLGANPINLTYDGQDADTSNGIIAYLTFSMPENASGNYPISLSYNYGDVYDNDLNDLTLSLVDGAICAEQEAETSPFIFSGAQIRTEGKQGLRFVFELEKETYELLTEEQRPKSYSDTGIGFGSIVIHKALLGDNILTKETEGAAIVPAIKLFEDPIAAITYTVCITDTVARNYTDEYVAVPYITYLDKGAEVTVYGEQTENITIYSIADLAYKDTSNSEEVRGYLFENILSVVYPDYEK